MHLRYTNVDASALKYTMEDISNMLEFLVDIFLVFTEKVFQQTAGKKKIWQHIVSLSSTVDIILYSYKATFLKFLLIAVMKQLANIKRLLLRWIYHF